MGIWRSELKHNSEFSAQSWELTEEYELNRTTENNAKDE